MRENLGLVRRDPKQPAAERCLWFAATYIYISGAKKLGSETQTEGEKEEEERRVPTHSRTDAVQVMNWWGTVTSRLWVWGGFAGRSMIIRVQMSRKDKEG